MNTFSIPLPAIWSNYLAEANGLLYHYANV